MQLKDWTLQIESDCEQLAKNTVLQAEIPGDITNTLYRAGLIADPIYGMNHNDLTWIPRQDFSYTAHFDMDIATMEQEEVLLHFDSVDLFADIYLNGHLLGKTQNAFLQYTYEIKRFLREKDNVLRVLLRSTVNVMDKIECDEYIGIFNKPRIFLRKPQCHFSWDWAPNMPSYGIPGKVWIEGVSATRLVDVNYRAHNSGKLTLIAKVNYDIMPTVDEYGVPIPNTAWPTDGDQVVFYLETAPGSGQYIQKTVDMMGKITFVNFAVDDPQLWWPNGYGEQPMYRYRVELLRGGKTVSEKQGRCAFREVSLVQEPKDDRMIGFEFYINGVKVFAKGSNWVPSECFSGCITEKKLHDLLCLAKEGNLNMLRVWGGGAYEKDFFYDTCDDLGLMVFQDFMFACSDLPENDPAWEKNTIAECEYQITRLRNHPCIVYWSGGNEKAGCCVHQKPIGDYFIDYILTGIVARMDPTRPFGRQSPCGLADLGNDPFSGDTHYGNYERCMGNWPQTEKTCIGQYRKLLAEKVVGFVTEFVTMGPDSEQTMRKNYPVDKLWPISEYWVDRMTRNPYDGLGGIPFATRIEKFITDLYGKPDSLSSFIAKGMQLQGEFCRAEIEWNRANQPATGGILNWMFNDIWPCGTCSVVDYYTEPKQAYYQMRRACKPVMASFIENKQGITEVFAVNETVKPICVTLTYGCRTLSGETLCRETCELTLKSGQPFRRAVTFPVDTPNTYLYAVLDDGVETVRNVYSPDLWASAEFSGRYTVKAQQISQYSGQITVKAEGFVKGIYLSFPENSVVRFSDNYLDMEDGQEITVQVTSDRPIDLQSLKVTDLVKMVGDIEKCTTAL